MSILVGVLEKCALDGVDGCSTCKYMYKHHCFVTDEGDLDYLKALFDLNEEFSGVSFDNPQTK
jgi:hypothetical protein